MSVTENDQACLSLKLSKARRVNWLRNSSPVVPDDRFQVSVSAEGLEHSLTIQEASLPDVGEYMVEIDDLEYGVLKSTCSLDVKGFLFLEIIFFCIKKNLYTKFVRKFGSDVEYEFESKVNNCWILMSHDVAVTKELN